MPLNPNTSVADGVLPHGAFDITILETGLDYVADSFSGDDKVKKITANNSRGNPRRRKLIKGEWEGSCDLQLAEYDTPKPDMGQTFVADEDGDGTAEPFMVVESGRSFAGDDVYKCKCSIVKMLTPLIYGSAGKTTAQLAAGLSSASTVAISSITMSAYLPAGQTIVASSWSASGLPTGLSISASTGAITGTPSTPGTYVVTVKVQSTRTYTRNGSQVTETLTGSRTFIWTIT